jgi:erythronate-4-phosphate dehydrogenase
MKILIDSKIPFLCGIFEPYMEVDYRNAADITPSAVANADALIVRTRTACNAALLCGSQVKFIATATIGTDHIDADFCRRSGIAWTNAAGCNAGAVCQYVATALLTVARRRDIILQGKTIGIVGVGNVGRRVAAFAAQMGMRVLLCDPPRAEKDGNDAFVSLDKIANEAHIVTFHVPLTHSGKYAAYHLANEKFFGQLAQQPVFINTSRGEVVDEAALRTAVLQKQVSAAILDVWENEPFINTATLQLADIGTPHIAGYSAEGKARAGEMAVQAVAHFFGLPLADWKMPALPPYPTPMLNTNTLPQESMYRFYRHFYNIEADDAALRAAPHDGERLRNEYVLRREPDSIVGRRA